MADDVTTAGPTPDDLRQAITASPALCPLEWSDDGQSVLFGRFSEEAYREVSFFDRRAVPLAERTGVVPWRMVEPWLARLPTNCDLLFHVSHCGSTLLSRLLGSHPRCLAVREPGILRGLRPDDEPGRIDAVLGLLSRTFHADQRPLVKATSVVNAVAPQLLARTSGRALLVFIPAETFLTAVLDGSRSDIAAHAASRWQRLEADGLSGPAPTAPGEEAAAAWLCEMRALDALARSEPGRCLWIDFERFLDEPAGELARMYSFLGLGLNLDVQAIVAGPLMRRYAKQPDVAYDAALRESLLARARETLADEITAGLAWLDHVASHIPRPALAG